jgi:alpha-L-fucosidase
MQLKKIFSLVQAAFLFTQMYAQVESIRFQNTLKVEAGDTKETILEKAAHVVPSKNQWEALENKFIAFVHFGPNTFTRMEWGSGKEDPKVFDLKELHTDQWCEAMKAAGIKLVVLTVKHHDGFCLWQTRYTKHGIMSTPFKNGKGDILKELAESCRKYGIKLGVYLSPADLFQIESPDGLYGNLSKYTRRTIPREVPGRPFANKTKFEFEVDDYNEYFLNQLFELLTEYGVIHEVWFDGAHPKRKGDQKYNYKVWRELVRKLAPHAVIFGREDIRWCGNEGGGTRETEWNVIPYTENPHTMTEFTDLTNKDLGSLDVLLNKEKPYYLHYQPAETNTSIREGWFFSEDSRQKVRSADDVFDIYERSVGGNSYLMLNIPPNREGKFPDRDVDVLREVGKRIGETYGNTLFKDAKGPKQVLDNTEKTFLVLDKQPQEIIIATPKPITFNRLMIREPVAVHGERIAKHAVDAYIDGNWKEIAHATNIGNRRILRFPDVTTDRIRIRILDSRSNPAISSVSAYYYQSRPPVLDSKRSLEGMVSIEPKNKGFNWNRTGENSGKNLNAGYRIFYTIDGTEPTASSKEYKEPFFMENAELKAIAILNDEHGPVYSERFGSLKQGWKITAVSSETQRQKASAAFDENPYSYWMTEEGNNHFISLDLGKEITLNGFAYTPQTQHHRGMIEQGLFQRSDDGKSWKEVEKFEFGNLINDPAKRFHYFKNKLKARYIRIEVLRIAADDTVASMAELDVF